MAAFLDEKKFPHLHLYNSLGGHITTEGEEFHDEHYSEISNELLKLLPEIYKRKSIGDNRKIHMGDE